MQVDYSPLAGNRQAIPSLHSFTNVYQVVMRALVQRVTQAAVHVEGQTVGSIGQGLVILLGIADGDTAAIAEGLAKKIAQMRIFGDSGGRFNVCATDLGAAALVISQFTLYADTRKGRRPSLTQAAQPDVAAPLVEHFAQALETHGVPVRRGVFGAHMLVEIHNDGPVTIWLDTNDLARPRRALP